MAEFTKGPWGFKNSADDEFIEISVEGRKSQVEIASVEIGFDPPFEDEQHANAHLIAAAPDLYETLSLVLAELCDENKYEEDAVKRNVINKGYSVLLKATGS